MSRIILIVAAFWTCLFLSACSEEKSDIEFLSEAQALYQEGARVAAEIAVKIALQINGNKANARTLLARIHLDIGNALAAEKELSRALELGASEDAVRPLLTKAILAQDRNQDVIDMEVPQVFSAATSADLRTIQGLAWLRAGESRKARESAPDSVVHMDTLRVILYLRGGDESLERAHRLSNQAHSMSPKDPTIAFHNAQIKLAIGEREKAILLLQSVTKQPAFPELSEARDLLKSLERG